MIFPLGLLFVSVMLILVAYFSGQTEPWIWAAVTFGVGAFIAYIWETMD